MCRLRHRHVRWSFDSLCIKGEEEEEEEEEEERPASATLTC
jgi:hypothetical protein